jgi:phospholipid/cholesterol/gamma-HCH transport system substrate-binding protein
MLTRRIRLQVALFTVIALAGVCYVGIRYVGLLRWAGASGYQISVQLRSTGGLFPNAEVTDRGVPVGRVSSLALTATGVTADVRITSGQAIPSDLVATVTDRSVIGEQFLDLRPATATGPYLHDGSVVPVADTRLPPTVQGLLVSSTRFVHSIPVTSLHRVINELFVATKGMAPHLHQLIVNSRQLATTFAHKAPDVTRLITSSRTVLSTQLADSRAIGAFAGNIDRIGHQLASEDGDLRRFVADAPPALNDVAGLVNTIHGPLGTLLTGLFTTSQSFADNHRGLHELVVQLPVAVSIGSAVTTPQGINVGLVPTFFDPLPCTDGYAGTARRTGLDTGPGATLNTTAGCRSAAGTGQDLRGSQHAP